jgi:peptidoglycan/LPS O-acetylase OafA/YrhL
MATRKPLTRTQRLARWFKSDAGQKFTHRVPALIVFGVAAWQSYWHTVEVATHYGEAASAPIMPLGIDGLLVVANRYMTHSKTRSGRIVSVLAFVFGVAATLFINMLAADPNPIARFLAALPAVAMVFTAGMLHKAERPRRRR